MERIKSRVKTVTLQQCSDPCSAAESPNSKHPLSQPFLIRLSWNFVWLLSRWKVSSLESKSWPYSTSVFHAALQNLQTLNNLYISHFYSTLAQKHYIPHGRGGGLRPGRGNEGFWLYPMTWSIGDGLWFHILDCLTKRHMDLDPQPTLHQLQELRKIIHHPPR